MVDLLDAAALGMLAAVLLLLAATIAVFVAAVWLGMHVIAPRLGRALDRAETEDDTERDRPD